MKNFKKIFETLPPGAAMDLIRCNICYDKFRGEKCTSLGSSRSLLKRKLIIKNKNNKYIPTKLGFELGG